MLRLGLRCKVYPEEDVVLLMSPVCGAEEDTVENLRFIYAWCGTVWASYNLFIIYVSIFFIYLYLQRTDDF